MSVHHISPVMSWKCWFCCFLCCIPCLGSGCPTWTYYHNATGKCECGHGLLCRSSVEIKNDNCATSHPDREGEYYFSPCRYRHKLNKVNRLLSEMPRNASNLDEVMCGSYNRQGLLCGECKKGYGPGVYSFDLTCASCSKLKSGYAIIIYLFLQFFPTTLIFISMAVFHFDITSGPLLGYLLFCQIAMISITGGHRYTYDYIQSDVSTFLRALLLLSVTTAQFWNLQFFKAVIPPFCISHKLTDIHVHMLNFVSTVYSLFLITLSCILMDLHARNYRVVVILFKPFKILLSKTNIRAVTSDAFFRAFASFIFLSSISVLFATYQVLYSTPVYTSTGIIQESVVFINPTVKVFSHKYILYTLIAGVLSIIFSVVPSLLLCIYPTRVYQYLSTFLSARKRLAITAFAEALHSCFKDGLNGTRDYRALAGATVFVLLFYRGASHFLKKFISTYFASDLVYSNTHLDDMCMCHLIFEALQIGSCQYLLYLSHDSAWKSTVHSLLVAERNIFIC